MIFGPDGVTCPVVGTLGQRPRLAFGTPLFSTCPAECGSSQHASGSLWTSQCPPHTHTRVLRGPTPPQMLEEAPQVAGAVPKGLAVGCPPSQLPSAPGCRAPRTVQGGPRARQTRGPHGTDAWGAGGWPTPPRRLALPHRSLLHGRRQAQASPGGRADRALEPALPEPSPVGGMETASSQRWAWTFRPGRRGAAGEQEQAPQAAHLPGSPVQGARAGASWGLGTADHSPAPSAGAHTPPPQGLCLPARGQTDGLFLCAQGDSSTSSHGVGCSAPLASRWGQAHWGDKGTEAPRRPHEAAVGAGWTPQGFTAQGRWLRAGSGPRPASAGGPCHALARATLTCPGALHPPCPSPPTSCLAPRWLSGPPSSSLVDARGPLPFSGRSLGSRYLQGPRGQKGASRRRPPLASGVGLGLGSRPRPGPPARGGGAAGSASGPEAAWPSAAQVYCTAP